MVPWQWPGSTRQVCGAGRMHHGGSFRRPGPAFDQGAAFPLNQPLAQLSGVLPRLTSNTFFSGASPLPSQCVQRSDCGQE